MFLNVSKYKNVYGVPERRERCYERLSITDNSAATSLICVNGAYMAINCAVSGGGSFAIIPLEQYGRQNKEIIQISGHERPILVMGFSPYNSQYLATGGDDGLVKIWDIPQDGLCNDEIAPIRVLEGHTNKVTLLEFHPSARNVLASAGADGDVRLWNLEKAETSVIFANHPEMITSMSFSLDGSKIATACKDKKIRVFDTHTGTLLGVFHGHPGPKPMSIVWAGEYDMLMSVGFSKNNTREVALWDLKDLATTTKPISLNEIDSGSSVLSCHYDHITKILYIAGRGDGNIRYYELDPKNHTLTLISIYQSTIPQRSIVFIPRIALNPLNNEVARIYKVEKDGVEPITFVVPRKPGSIVNDLVERIPSTEPAMTATEFFSGKNAIPLYVPYDVKKAKAHETSKAALPPMTTSSVQPPSSSTCGCKCDCDCGCKCDCDCGCKCDCDCGCKCDCMAKLALLDQRITTLEAQVANRR